MKSVPVKTCTNIDCPERTGGKCNAGESVPVEECCDGECNHDDCCGKVEANCTHTCRDCSEKPVIVWLDVGKFCRECFEKEYIKQNGDYRLHKK